MRKWYYKEVAINQTDPMANCPNITETATVLYSSIQLETVSPMLSPHLCLFVTFVGSLCQLGHQQVAGHLTGWTPVAYRVAVGGYISYSRGEGP